jgi:hypothetical protein
MTTRPTNNPTTHSITYLSVSYINLTLINCLNKLASFMIVTFISIYFFVIGFIYILNCFLIREWDLIMDYFNRRRIIMDRENNEPYLIRYYVFLKERKNFPFNIFIHKFLKSDPDDLHDHPWNYTSFILWGGYWEYTEKERNILKNWRSPGYLVTRDASWKHRLELDPKVPVCWTIFIPHRRRREWGFYKDKDGEEEWIDADKYFDEKSNNKND